MQIKVQLILLAGSTLIIIFFIIMFIYFRISNVITNNNHRYTSNYFRQINSSIVERCELIGHILSNIAYNSSVQNYIMEDDKLKRFELSKDISNIMMNMQTINKDILEMYIQGTNGNYLSLHGGIFNLNNMVNSLPENINNYYSEVKTLDYGGTKQDCFIIATTVKSIIADKNQGNRIGTAVIVLKADALGLESDTGINSSEPTVFCLVDRNNKVYSSNTEKDSLYESFMEYASYNAGDYVSYKKGKKYFISTENIPKIGGMIISIAPEELLLSDLYWVRRLTFAILMVAVALLSFPFLFIINNIVTPVKELLKFINAVRNNELKLFKNRLKLEGFEEIEIVAVEFNNMLDEIENLTQGLVAKSTMLYEAELSKKQAELAFLKSQINPHFLYNTLEAMKGCAFNEGSIKTAGMAKALAQIFRYSVKGDNIVCLKDELDIVKSYVQIQQMRFDNKFDVTYDFTNEALLCRLPKMLLQPIVENAIFHGLEGKLGKGSLRIEAYMDVMQDIVIVIEDDGIGIEEEALNAINNNLENNSEMSTIDNTSIGIFNVNNRIKLTYGGKYGIKVYSVLDKGTKVVLKIPNEERAV